MPTVQVLTPPTATAEPVSLALANSVLRLDLDLSSTDDAIKGQVEYLQLLLSAAREKVEAYTGRFFAPQTLQLTYALAEAYELPTGATAVSVSGYFDTLDALATRVTYLEEYRKAISISRELDWPYPALAQTYTVTAEIPENVNVPALAKSAILELTGEWFRNRETTLADVRSVVELPVSWKVKLSALVVNPIGY
jgi:hypothetical protein